MEQISINVVDHCIGFDLVDSQLFDACTAPLPDDQPLMRQVVSDLEYGVSNRPSIPACFDDQEQVDNFEVDTVTDIRYSSWDRAADACRQRPIVVTVGEPPADDPTPPSDSDPD